jgi:hypothetical protein
MQAAHGAHGAHDEANTTMLTIHIDSETARRFVLGKQDLWPGQRCTGAHAKGSPSVTRRVTWRLLYQLW